MKVLDISLNQIKPYTNNPRNNDRAVEVVAQSIKEFGFKTVKISFRIYISERDDGYQEIYINNNWENATKDPLYYKKTHDKSKELSKREFSDSVEIDIDKLEDVIYFTYEADGDGPDSWYNEWISVEFTALK